MKAGLISTVAVLAATFSGAHADSSAPRDDVVNRLEREVAQLRAELEQVKAQNNKDWLSEARAEEMRNLVYDVLADADTRASLMQNGATSGYDGGFFIQSTDGKYKLRLNGHLQVRFIWNNREESAGGAIDEDTYGFQIRRSKLKGKGHIGDPKIGYAFSLAGARSDDNAFFEDYYLNYRFDNGLLVQAGRWKQPFARENIISSARQMAVERSLVLETFNVDRSEGIMLEYNGDRFRIAGAFNDGIDGDFTEFNNDWVDFGLTGRVDFLAMGEWSQSKDFASWSGQPQALFIGAAAHYQQGEDDTASEDDEVTLLTVDALYENNGFSAFGAFYWSDIEFGAMTAEHWGLEGQLAYNIDDTYEPFIRYEYIALDDDLMLVDDEISVITLGLNWYQKKHNAKLTIDVVYVVDHIDDDFANVTMFNPSSGLGLLDDDGDEDGQVAVRLQYQLAF